MEKLDDNASLTGQCVFAGNASNKIDTKGWQKWGFPARFAFKITKTNSVLCCFVLDGRGDTVLCVLFYMLFEIAGRLSHTIDACWCMVYFTYLPTLSWFHGSAGEYIYIYHTLLLWVVQCLKPPQDSSWHTPTNRSIVTWQRFLVVVRIIQVRCF